MNKTKKDKYYVVTPIKESHYDDDDFMLVGTKEDIAEYTKESVVAGFETKELDYEPQSRQMMYHIDFHCGSSDGKSGWGSSTVVKSRKAAKDWMEKYLAESQFEIPNTIIFNIKPVYWVTKSYLRRKKKMNELLNKD